MVICYRLFVARLREHQPYVEEAEVDAKLDKDFASWFEAHVSNKNSTIYIYIYIYIYICIVGFSYP